MTPFIVHTKGSEALTLAARKCKAFTLAELLMAVLVISIIMVALAPVITRRAYDNVSIEVNKKKGLEIYTNPGTYTFDIPVGINTLFLQGSGGGGGGGGATYIDKSVSITSNNTWTVPKGVSQLTFTITGSGGGGGAANGKENPSVDSSASHGTWTVYNNKCLDDEFLAIRAGDDETDTCITKWDVSHLDSGLSKTSTLRELSLSTETCTGGICCWKTDDKLCTVSSSGVSGCNVGVCTYEAATHACGYLHMESISKGGGYRLPTMGEFQKVTKYLNEWSRNAGRNGLGLCNFNYVDTGENTHEPPNVPTCYSDNRCMGAMGNGCRPAEVWVSDSYVTYFQWHNAANWGIYRNTNNTGRAARVRCARSLKRYTRYSGAGGASGAKFQRTINVLPNDTLAITIGSGGSGGTYNSSVNNGLGLRAGNGSQGANTQIVHKRGSVTMGTYYVKGGFGGWGATTSAHGKFTTNSVTPSGTCFAQYRTTVSSSLSGGAVSCTTNSNIGWEGTTSYGGQGGRVNNEGSAALGGTIYIDGSRGANQRNTAIEADKAKGQNADTAGYGAGGGFTPGWVTKSSHFFGGGKGGSGKIDIQYRIMLPGSGGGSGTRVGGSKTIAEKDTLYEIKYKVKEGSRLVFEIGAGGTGGVQGQDGTHGSPTIIGDNKIIFLAGEGGKTVNQTQKNNLSSCIGSNINSTTIANCINSPVYKATGGRASYVSANLALITNALGLIINDLSNVSYTISSNFKGSNGKSGAQNFNTAPYTYGFDGGVGGSPFGIRANSINASITCGGGISGNYGTTNTASYICTSGAPEGNNAKTHDPVNNEFGGSGGGGGGVVDTSFTLGSGGNGSSGYLRIRWDESEQE